MHRSLKAMLLAIHCAAAATLTAQPAYAGPFDGLKKIAEKVERKAAEAYELRQRVESVRADLNDVADAIGIRDRQPGAVDGTREDPAADACASPQACEIPGNAVDYTGVQQQADEDRWPEMEPAKDMEGDPQ